MRGGGGGIGKKMEGGKGMEGSRRKKVGKREGMEGKRGKEMNKGTGEGKFGGSEGRKKKKGCPNSATSPTANPQSLEQELVQISEIFGLVKQYIRMGSYPVSVLSKIAKNIIEKAHEGSD